MKTRHQLTSMLTVMIISSSAFAYKYEGTHRTAPHPNPHVTAGCAPATAATELNINNNRALIQSGGDMWWDFNSAQYEVPKGSGINALFLGTLWLGGQDVSGQLKVAAQRYRSNGNDYWTGPLSTVTSEIEAATCTQWDKHFVTFRDQVAKFNAWYEAGLYDAENGTNTQQEDFPGYSIPDTILNWPAHGRNYEPYNEDFYLAPFYDRNGDGVYNPIDGDYPGYDLKGEIDCSERIASIYGDMNLWWIFNDKGSVHTESGSNAIGMEIRGQAFGFATNDEVNNMTFYNYELVNRSTFTLTQTYFGQNVDPDLGCYNDDYVGCDVERGLGYCYNGDQYDEDCQGALGYGDQPPAIGVDFFQGPFQDNDGVDNPLTTNISQAQSQLGIPYKGIGVGYSDGVVDNERFGMRKFLYYNNTAGILGDPSTGVQYYNYLRSYWKDGSRMCYGGNGHVSGGCDPNVLTDYMFPDDTDPLGWGTDGVPQLPWNEITAGNTPADRRFIQSAGPFTLAPGAVNYITVGVVWARATSGGNFASVQELRRADDKTQAMFDNCFRVLNGPDAPDLTIQEMDKTLIIYISNKKVSNNYNEEYEELSPFIFPPDTNPVTGQPLTQEEMDAYRKYTFQGYMLYQLKDESVSPADLDNPDLARLIAQCDIKDGVGQIVNMYFDKNLNADVPVEEVNGADKGVVHSFKITEDKFASGDPVLVNHKTYYFMAVAYGYNAAGTLTPDAPFTYVKEPFLASRKSSTGGIKVYAGIPHKSSVETGGTQVNSQYGDQVEITRIEGQGNGGHFLRITQASRDEIMSGPPWRVKHPTYEKGYGPVTVKVVDPLNVPDAEFTIAFRDSATMPDLSDAYWLIWRNDTTDTVYADKAIAVQNEQLLLNWGLSVTIEQQANPSTSNDNPETYGDAIIGASLTFTDPTKPWLTGVEDAEGITPQNWIRSGTATMDDDNQPPYIEPFFNDYQGVDDDEYYEKLNNGTWAPFKLVANRYHGPLNDGQTLVKNLNKIEYLAGVDIVFTADKSKWTRCPVLEMQNDKSLAKGNPAPNSNSGAISFLRDAPSVDKDGNPADTTGGGSPSSDPDSPSFISPTGMGWFPGYAINVETGERLNMAFGEDSWLEPENGNDMIWNPTSNIFEGPFEDVRFGGKHYIFIFRNNIMEDGTNQVPDQDDRCPAYDDGKWLYDHISAYKYTFNVSGDPNYRYTWRACMWVGLPLLEHNRKLLETDALVSLRVTKPYAGYPTGEWLNAGDQLTPGETYYVNQGPITTDTMTYSQGDWFTAVATSFAPTGNDSLMLLSTTVNAGLPMYTFSTSDLATLHNVDSIAVSALDLIGVVPNPYYAYSEYEKDKLDNRIKVINLPQTCTVTIYSINGTLIRRFEKDDPTVTSLDWDLKNHAGIPIASGIYVIHINVPGVGEKVLKWYGMLRPVDLDAF